MYLQDFIYKKRLKKARAFDLEPKEPDRRNFEAFVAN